MAGKFEPQLHVRGDAVPGLVVNPLDEQPAMNGRGDTIIAQGMPANAELVRLGKSWQATFVAGVAALTGLPTTVAGLSLWNGEVGAGGQGGICYLIEAFGTVEEVLDATQADTSALFACNNVAPVAAPSATAGILVKSLSGRGAYDGKARLMSGLTVTNDGWFPHGAEAQVPLASAVAAAIWKINEAKVQGLYLVPPGGMFNVQVVKVAAAASQQFHFVRWHEVLISYKT